MLMSVIKLASTEVTMIRIAKSIMHGLLFDAVPAHYHFFVPAVTPCTYTCLHCRCSFNSRLGILERDNGNTGLPDICAIVQGLAVWLQSQNKQHVEVTCLAYMLDQ